jgi:hypothetical protein
MEEDWADLSPEDLRHQAEPCSRLAAHVLDGKLADRLLQESARLLEKAGRKSVNGVPVKAVQRPST